MCKSATPGQGILADFTTAYELFVAEDTRLDVDLYSGFDSNGVRLRAELRALGVMTRPSGVFLIDLTSAVATRAKAK